MGFRLSMDTYRETGTAIAAELAALLALPRFKEEKRTEGQLG